MHELPWITIFGSLVMRFANDFHLWLRHSWKSLANRLIRDPRIIIHGNSCIILYILHSQYHDHWWPVDSTSQGIKQSWYWLVFETQSNKFPLKRKLASGLIKCRPANFWKLFGVVLFAAPRGTARRCDICIAAQVFSCYLESVYSKKVFFFMFYIKH